MIVAPQVDLPTVSSVQRVFFLLHPSPSSSQSHSSAAAELGCNNSGSERHSGLKVMSSRAETVIVIRWAQRLTGVMAQGSVSVRAERQAVSVTSVSPDIYGTVAANNKKRKKEKRREKRDKKKRDKRKKKKRDKERKKKREKRDKKRKKREKRKKKRDKKKKKKREKRDKKKKNSSWSARRGQFVMVSSSWSVRRGQLVVVSSSWSSATPRVCDDELLRCQNGGVCVNNVRCQCAPGYSGLLCEKVRSDGEAGYGSSDSDRTSKPSSVIILLLLMLLRSTWALSL
ncbi:hypothetical protein QTP70_006421 [Hemibagrus guttatus]|uniref:EGF-like domain-containing protein n=1 Tax=Hemibagrus guttatus TaxID=175788 RepID=A0AAE0RCQ4_9TELE|nr:hypothetical protein QTP70_006421 [Hemibagrus guttatus]